MKKHEYWDEKPTLRDDKDQPPGSVEGERKVEEVRQEPYALPREGMTWCNIDINDEGELDEVLWLRFSFTTC